MYTDVAKNLDKFSIKMPKTKTPSATDDDYEIGYIYRYFVRKVNDKNALVYEINSDDINEYNNSPFWSTAIVLWRISGDIDDKFDPISKSIKVGVLNSNKYSIQEGTKTISNLKLYIPDFLLLHESRKPKSN